MGPVETATKAELHSLEALDGVDGAMAISLARVLDGDSGLMAFATTARQLREILKSLRDARPLDLTWLDDLAEKRNHRQSA